MTSLQTSSTQNSFQWAYKLKLGGEEKFRRFKVRLVTNGFTQRPGIFLSSGEVRIFTCPPFYSCCFLTRNVATQRKTVLKKDLDEDLYMAQPEWFISLGHKKNV